MSPLTLTFTLSLLLVLLPLLASAKPCAIFDTSANLYLFGGTQDVKVGGNETWSSPSPTTLSTTNRPSFSGNNTQCFLNQYANAMYVLGADSTQNVYVYDFGAGSWSVQGTSGGPDLSTGSTILDHDTNAFYQLNSAGTMYSLDFGSASITTTATSSSVAWQAVENPSFSTTGYNPVLAEASNHVLFFGVPSTAAGSADIFVIHYSYFQPDAQAFNETNGASSNFPDSHGVAIGVPYAASTGNAGAQIVFVPDDFSATYVVTHWVSPTLYSMTSDAPAGILPYINSTQTLPAPTAQDVNAVYASSDTALVQLDSAGDLYYITSAYGNGYAVSTSASWTKSGYTYAGLSGTVSTVSSAASGSSSATASSSGSATGSRSSGAASSTSGSAKSTGTSSGTASASSAASTSSGAGRAVMGVGKDAMMIASGLVCMFGAGALWAL